MKLTLRFLSRLTQSKEIKTKIKEFSQLRPTPLSVQHLLDLSIAQNLEKSSNFLLSELPIRISGAITEMDSLPTAFKKIDTTNALHEMYCVTFADMLDLYNESRKGNFDIDEYFRVISNILHRHSNVVEIMATGHTQYIRSNDVPLHEEKKINYFLDRFFMRRISIRMLCHQTLMAYHISKDASLANKKQFKAIEKSCDVEFILKLAIENATLLCEQQFFTSPTVHIKRITKKPEENITVTYAPNYLYYILFETMKNAFRAVVECHHNDKSLPSIEVQLVKGAKDVVIIVNDEGGGIPSSLCHKVFHYTYTTAHSPLADSDGKLSTLNAPFAGFGYGLPLSRLYARYLHGDLVLISQEGYGTKVFVYLSAADDMVNEILPLCSIASKRVFSTTETPPEWVVS